MGESAENGYSDQWERLGSLLDAHGPAAGILVQPSSLGTDNTYLLDVRGEAPDRLRGMAVIEPRTGREEPDRLVEAGVCGIRLNPISLPVPPLGEQLWSGPRRGLLVPHQATFALPMNSVRPIFVAGDEFPLLPPSCMVNTKEAEAGMSSTARITQVATVGIRVTDQ